MVLSFVPKKMWAIGLERPTGMARPALAEGGTGVNWQP